MNKKDIITLVIVGLLFILFNFTIPNYNLYIKRIGSDILSSITNFLIVDNKNYDDYELIKNENIELNKEIIELKEMLELNKVLVDKNIVNASILSRDVTYWYDIITIDKGKSSGVSLNEGALYNGYLIGIVSEVNDNNAKVRLLTNSKTKLSIKVTTDCCDTYGILVGYDNGYYIVEGISNEDIKVGSKVYTTGLSENIPSGIMIGKVESIASDNFDLTKKLFIKSPIDMDNIKYITLVGKA